MGTQGLTALLIGAMPVPPRQRLLPLLGERPLVICADGGLQRAGELGLKPDFYVGDNDSGGSPPPGIPSWLLPREKDLTDMEMALQLALEQGAEQLLLCGCSGGRLDHQLANLFLLERLARAGKRAHLVDEHNLVCCLLPGVHRFSPIEAYPYFSLLPLDSSVQELCLSGCKYPLQGATVPRGSTLTVSNEILPGRELQLSFTRGTALFIRSV